MAFFYMTVSLAVCVKHTYYNYNVANYSCTTTSFVLHSNLANVNVNVFTFYA